MTPNEAIGYAIAFAVVVIAVSIGLACLTAVYVDIKRRDK